MIDEAIGKILGMAMAYLASALGMFLAYVNYRKRTVKAQRVMTPAAWAVIAVTVLAIVGGVLVVGQMAAAPAAAAAPQAAPVPAPAPPPEVMEEAELDRDEVVQRWPWIGVVVPGAIFLFATIVTAALHRHFSVKGH
jgi:hypothetical protein